jgi:hypothetical protein
MAKEQLMARTATVIGLDRNVLDRRARDRWQGLHVLRRAWECARELGESPWEFAVELSTLSAAGLTHNDVRWLVRRGYAEHGRDVSSPLDTRRQFELGGPLVPTRRRCVVLTAMGIQQLFANVEVTFPSHQVSRLFLSSIEFSESGTVEDEGEDEGWRPRWDSDRGELWMGDTLVKQFRLPSPNQRIVLMAFEEQDWPQRIDDPLPPHPEIAPQRRLNATIMRLNRNQRVRCIRFRGDGSGLGLVWEPIVAQQGP